MRTRILLILAVLITYGSLYPFNFKIPAESAAAWERLLLDWTQFTSKGDALGNFGLFVPFGFAGVFTIPGHWRRPPGIASVVFISFVLATVVQIVQIYFPPRVPAMADVVWNMLGAAFGIFVGWYLRGRVHLRAHAWDDAYTIPVALIALWFAAELLPLVPSLDFQSIKNSVKALLRLSVSPDDILWHAAGALVAGGALKAIFGTERAVHLLGVLVLAVIAGKVLIVTRVLNASTLAGLAIGYGIWRYAWGAKRPLRGESLIAVLLLAAYTLKALEPWELRSEPASFNWLPFGSMLQGSMIINSMVLVESVFVFASVLGMVRMQGSRIGATTIVLALWVGALEAVQMYLVGRTPDITEPLLVLLTGVMLRYAPIASRGRNRGRPGDLPGGAPEPEASRHPRRSERISAAPLAAADRDASPSEAAVRSSASRRAGELRVPGLDGLRAVACLMVFGAHFGQTTRLQGSVGPFDVARLLDNGNSGVALFFVLTGFLLSLPYWNSLRADTALPATGEYLLRRAARILPAYFACLTILIIVNRFWEKSNWVRDALLHYTLAFNYLNDTIFRINAPFWTLAVEAQFYLLLPLVFLIARKLRPVSALALVVTAAVAAYLANYFVMSSWVMAHVPARPPAVLTYSLLAHLPLFLMGMATSWIFVFRDLRPSVVARRADRRLEAGFWICVALVLLIFSTPLDDVLQIPYGRYNLPYLALLLCALVLLTPLTASGRWLLESTPLRLIGIVSYSVYLYHLPIQHSLARHFPALSLDARENWLAFGAISLVLSLAAAAISYVLLEKPILRKVHSRTRQLARGATPRASHRRERHPAAS